MQKVSLYCCVWKTIWSLRFYQIVLRLHQNVSYPHCCGQSKSANSIFALSIFLMMSCTLMYRQCTDNASTDSFLTILISMLHNKQNLQALVPLLRVIWCFPRPCRHWVIWRVLRSLPIRWTSKSEVTAPRLVAHHSHLRVPATGWSHWQGPRLGTSYRRPEWATGMAGRLHHVGAADRLRTPISCPWDPCRCPCENPFRFICQGQICTSQVILTASDCSWFKLNRIYPCEERRWQADAQALRNLFCQTKRLSSRKSCLLGTIDSAHTLPSHTHCWRPLVHIICEELQISFCSNKGNCTKSEEKDFLSRRIWHQHILLQAGPRKDPWMLQEYWLDLARGEKSWRTFSDLSQDQGTLWLQITSQNCRICSVYTGLTSRLRPDIFGVQACSVEPKKFLLCVTFHCLYGR